MDFTYSKRNNESCKICNFIHTSCRSNLKCRDKLSLKHGLKFCYCSNDYINLTWLPCGFKNRSFALIPPPQMAPYERVLIRGMLYLLVESLLPVSPFEAPKVNRTSPLSGRTSADNAYTTRPFLSLSAKGRGKINLLLPRDVFVTNSSTGLSFYRTRGVGARKIFLGKFVIILTAYFSLHLDLTQLDLRQTLTSFLTFKQRCYCIFRSGSPL